MFKLEKVMDDFRASTPEHRGPHNPNVEYVPFEEMKMRILKIVDGYNGWVKLIISRFADRKQILPHIPIYKKQNNVAGQLHVPVNACPQIISVLLFFHVINERNDDD